MKRHLLSLSAALLALPALTFAQAPGPSTGSGAGVTHDAGSTGATGSATPKAYPGSASDTDTLGHDGAGTGTRSGVGTSDTGASGSVSGTTGAGVSGTSTGAR